MNTETIEDYPLLRECVELLIRRKTEADKGRTAGNYQSAWNKFSVFLGGDTSLFKLSDLNSDLIRQYRLWLLEDETSGNDQLKPGSQDFYLRNLKAIYNKLKKEPGIHIPPGNPFEGINITVPPTRKRALPKQKISMLTRLSFREISELPEFFNQPGRLEALQLALFLFYARGMCFIDVFQLQQENVKEQYILYTRSKTGASLQVKITPEMQFIMDQYWERGNPWVFPFLHKKIVGRGEMTPQSALHRINTYLKEVGDAFHFPIPFTTYVMRHSWASMMLEADSEISVISQSMGHTSLLTTEIYLGQLSIAKMDKASDNMLNHLLRNPHLPKKTVKQRPLPAVRSKSRVVQIVPAIPTPVPKSTFIAKCKNMIEAITAKILLFV